MPHTIVITGGSRGLGRACAQEFARRGDHVLVCSRTPHHVHSTTRELVRYAEMLGHETCIAGRVVDVGSHLEMRQLADDALEMFGHVDAWINCAGSNGYEFVPITAQDPGTITTIVDTNLLGAIWGTREAIRIGTSHVFNILGGGSSGEPTPNFGVYGSTKCAVEHFSRTVDAEESGVAVHRVNPGFIQTELLESTLLESPPLIASIIRAFAEPPADVATSIVKKMKKCIKSASRAGTYIQHVQFPSQYFK